MFQSISYKTSDVHTTFRLIEVSTEENNYLLNPVARLGVRRSLEMKEEKNSRISDILEKLPKKISFICEDPLFLIDRIRYESMLNSFHEIPSIYFYDIIEICSESLKQDFINLEDICIHLNIPYLNEKEPTKFRLQMMNRIKFNIPGWFKPERTAKHPL